MVYELVVGLRYTRARRRSGRNGFVSFIAAVSMLGIALGVAALIVVLSVMNGFQEELRTRILAVASHIEIRGLAGGVADWHSLAQAARRNPRVQAAAPYVFGQAMLSTGEVNRGALVRGIDPALEDTVADFGSHMRAGALAALNPDRLGNAVTGVRLKLDDLFAAPRVAHELVPLLPVDAEVRDWTLSHANFFRAVAIEKRMMFLILTLIVAVAAFNIVSAQVMVVTDEQADIAILRTQGASPASILSILVIQGGVVGTQGTPLGLAGGLALAYNIDTVVPFLERVLGVQFLDKSVYYISELPSE